MKYLKRIYNNIKYILSNDLNLIWGNNVKAHLEGISKLNKLKVRIDEINDDIDGKCDGLESRIDEIGYDVDDKMTHDDVVDCIFDNPDYDLQEDVKKIKETMELLKDNTSNEPYDIMEQDLLIEAVINVIINRLSIDNTTSLITSSDDNV